MVFASEMMWSDVLNEVGWKQRSKNEENAWNNLCQLRQILPPNLGALWNGNCDWSIYRRQSSLNSMHTCRLAPAIGLIFGTHLPTSADWLLRRFKFRIGGIAPISPDDRVGVRYTPTDERRFSVGSWRYRRLPVGRCALSIRQPLLIWQALTIQITLCLLKVCCLVSFSC